MCYSAKVKLLCVLYKIYDLACYSKQLIELILNSDKNRQFFIRNSKLRLPKGTFKHRMNRWK